MKTKFKNAKGITLIALVITIIVLLILAGVTIATLTGNNGILGKANDAKTQTEQAKEDENLKIAIAGSYGTDGKLNLKDLKENLKNQEILYTDSDEFPLEVTIDGKTFTIASTGGTTAIDKISKSTSYVGYYADIDADGTADGVIYADLAVGNQGSGQWQGSDGKYTIPTVTEGLKDYYISQTNYKANDGFGTKDVISPTGTGAERFYIMALTDIDGKRNGTCYDWYDAASGKMSDYAETTSGDFGKGKSNTTTMITKWNAKAYGDQDKCSNHKDMWGQIKKEVNNGWFVPSRAEWLAFGGELGITPSNYGNFGLSDYYWSSSQKSTTNAWNANFHGGYVNSYYVDNYFYVRLSATF